MGRVLSYVFVLLFGVGIGFLVNQSGKNCGNDTAQAKVVKLDPAQLAKVLPTADNVERVKIPLGNAPVKGGKEALVTIVEFSDFECPFCSRVNPTLKALHDKYGDKVRVAFKHRPLPFHQNAKLAHQASVAAQKQGKFWEYHDKLFENTKALGRDQLLSYAKGLALDIAKFTTDMDAAAGQVQEDLSLADKVGAGGTPNFFINGVQLVGAQPLSKFVEIVDAQLKTAESVVAKGGKRAQVYDLLMAKALDRPKPKAPPTPSKPAAPKEPEGGKIVPVGSSPAWGPSDALVTIVEFSDFECPFCGKLAETARVIKKKYGEKVRFVFKHNPLGFHPNARPAAIASLAAHRQGKFFPFHDKLFENYRSLSDAKYEQFAKELGLNLDKFNKDRKDPALSALVDEDVALAGRIGARGTPTSYVNGKIIRGAQPPQNFEALINTEIKRAEKLLAEGVKKADLYSELLKRGKTEIPRTEVDITGSPFKGVDSAKVTIVEFSDFECPFCSRVGPTLKQINDNYGDQVKVVFKHLPLAFHQNAKLAAQASFAANKQGKFWEYHDKLFENQKALGRDQLISYAKGLNLNVNKFTADMDSQDAKSQVEKDLADAQKAGISGTPSFFVNGRKLVGALPFDQFKAVIDEEIKGGTN